MGNALWALALIGTGCILAALAARAMRLRRRTRERFAAGIEEEAPAEAAVAQASTFPQRFRSLPWLAGLAASAAIYLVLGWGAAFALAAGLIVALLGAQLEVRLAERKMARIEGQLADAIDLMVGALEAGASLLAALESAMAESRPPLRPQLEEMAGRIRLGDDPPAVFHSLSERVPLETFLLFSSALSVHWETGGNLVPTLSTVGRTIRDRTEIARRIRSNVAQSDVSTVAVLILTYMIALIMWRSNPEQMAMFLATTAGQWIVAATVLLQAVGIVWMAAMGRTRF